MKSLPIPVLRLLAVPALAVLAGCSTAHDVAVFTGVATKEPDPQAFVKETRPQTLTYMPVGVNAPPRKLAPRSKPEVDALQKELDARKASNEAAGNAAKTLGAKIPMAKPPVVAPPPAEGAGAQQSGEE